jgi:hypothetical protein
MDTASKRREALGVVRALGLATASIVSLGVASAAPALALELPAGATPVPGVATQSPPASTGAPAPDDAGGAGGTAGAGEVPGKLAESPRVSSPPSPSSPAPPNRPPAPTRAIRTLLEATVHAVGADVSGAPVGSEESSSSAASSAKPTSESGSRPSATVRRLSPGAGVAASVNRSTVLPRAGRATEGRGRVARAARTAGESSLGAAGTTVTERGAASKASGLDDTSGVRFDFRAPSRHGLTAAASSHGSLLGDLAPASSGSLLALLLVLAAAIGGTFVVLSGVGHRPRPRVRGRRRRVAAGRRLR